MYQFDQYFDSKRGKMTIDGIMRRRFEQRLWLRLVLGFGVVACTCTTTIVVQAASFTGLGSLSGGSFYSFAGGVSADGSTVVGGSQGANGVESFRWTQSSGMVGLGNFTGATYGEASSVSADGSTIVGYNIFGENGFDAFRWTQAEGLVNIGGAGFNSTAYKVSADGSTIVGEALAAGTQDAVRWTSTGISGLGYLPGNNLSRARGVSADGLTTVGFSATSTTAEAVRWTPLGIEGLGFLPGYDISEAYGVSADGSTVVGYNLDAAGYAQPFRWTQTTGMQDLGRLVGSTVGGFATGVSADGSVVVGQTDDATSSQAFLWTSNTGLKPLSQILADAGVDVTGWTLKSANGISSDGLTIVGFGTRLNLAGDAELTEAWMAKLDAVPQAVPTPALLPGLIGLGWKTWRKRKHQAIA
jgi:probable HAF family extracellular repeat protein